MYITENNQNKYLKGAYRIITFISIYIIMISCQSLKISKEAENYPEISAKTQEPAPIDWRKKISSGSFKKTGEGEWISPKIKTPFKFDELIYSWNIYLEDKEAFRIYLKVEFAPGDETEWLYAGFWGKVKDPVSEREKPKFDRGIIDMDWLKLKTKAAAFQYKVVDSGIEPLGMPPSLHVVTTDNHPTPELVKKYKPIYKSNRISTCVLDIPIRFQVDSKGNPLRSRCQSAALSSAMEYFGKPVNLEDVVSYTNDPEYNYPGLWPRVIGAANQFGFQGYVDRHRNWNEVRKTLAQHKVILCSIRMAEGDCKAPPYPKIGNHIVVLNGITEDGRAIVTDSALKKDNRGYCCQWLMEDFEKIWMKTKGGVSMVICEPGNAQKYFVENLAPFPADQYIKSENNN